MNRRNRAKSSSLFLLELILAILFFSIASAVCVQLFVKSHLLSEDAQVLNLAVSECSAAAEAIAASGDLTSATDQLTALYPEGATTSAGDADASVSVYYDENLQPCAEKSGVYRMIVQLRRADTMLSAAIEMQSLEDGGAIYQLDTEHHLQREAGNE